MDHVSGVCRSAIVPRERGKRCDEQERGGAGGNGNRFAFEDIPSIPVAMCCENDEQKQNCRCMERNMLRRSLWLQKDMDDERKWLLRGSCACSSEKSFPEACWLERRCTTHLGL